MRLRTTVLRESLRGDIVEGCHPETGHHSPPSLFGQQLVPHHLLGLEGMLCLQYKRIQSLYCHCANAAKWRGGLQAFIYKIHNKMKTLLLRPLVNFWWSATVAKKRLLLYWYCLYSPVQCGTGQQTLLGLFWRPSRGPRHLQPFQTSPYIRTFATAWPGPPPASHVFALC